MNAKLKFWRWYSNPLSRHRFSIAKWIFRETPRKLLDSLTVRQPAELPARKAVFDSYSEEIKQGKLHPATAAPVEEMVASDVTEALRQCGVKVFPPVVLRLAHLPIFLVVSHRDRLQGSSPSGVLLHPKLTPEQAAEIEQFVERQDQGLSALAVPLGGLALFPPMVQIRYPPTMTEIAGHEWCHTHLFFAPLGFGNNILGRGLGRIEENVCNLVGAEIFSAVAPKYGWDKASPSAPITEEFNTEMRTIRLRLDQLLAAGKAEEAEAYLESQGSFREKFKIRKLNQAYFTFYGSYGGPQAGGDPTRDYLLAVRSRCANLGEFLRKVKRIRNYKDLVRLAQAAS
ncbi:MAG: hypothetical protein WD940_00560 [Patescibacteria group bacterium]